MTPEQPDDARPKVIAALSLMLTLLSLFATGVWYLAHLDARVSAVEVAGKQEASQDDLTCAELAVRVADAYRSGDGSRVAKPLERLMDRMGCGAEFTS